jgi:hypothetical protein
VRRCVGSCCEEEEEEDEKEDEEHGRMSQAQCCEVEEMVEVAESRESERDMATEAGAKVEERMLEVGEEKKCILVVVVAVMMSVAC